MFVEKSTVDVHGYGMVARCEARNWLPMEVAWAAWPPMEVDGRPSLWKGGQALAKTWPPICLMGGRLLAAHGHLHWRTGQDLAAFSVSILAAPPTTAIKEGQMIKCQGEGGNSGEK